MSSRFPTSRLFRSGIMFIQAVLPSSLTQRFQGKAPSLHGNYPASSLLWASPTSTPAGPTVIGSRRTRDRGTTGRCGYPRFPVTSLRACSLQSPRDALRVLMLVTSPQMAGFAFSGELATSNGCNEAESSSLPLGLTRSRSGAFHPFAPSGRARRDQNASRVRLPTHEILPLHGEQAITIADTFQSARCPALHLAHQSSPRY